MSRFKSALDIASSVALIASAGCVMWTLFVARPRPQAPQPLVSSVSDLQIDAALVTNVTGRGQIAIVEFSDFQCPFCARHARETLPTLKNTLLAQGHVRYVALHYPIETSHPLALGASEASECAGRQGRFCEMHEELFRDPSTLGPEALTGHAKAIGLDVAEFRRCLDSDETIDGIRRHQREGRRLGVVATPSFFIGVVRPDGGIEVRTRIRGSAGADVFAAEVANLTSKIVRRSAGSVRTSPLEGSRIATKSSEQY